MDRLKRFFRRKDRKHDASVPAFSEPLHTSTSAKRERTPEDSADEAADNNSHTSPRKRVRRSSPDLTLHQQRSRVDSLSGSTYSSATMQREPPKLQWAPEQTGSSDLSSIFDNLAADRPGAGTGTSAAGPPSQQWNSPTPRARPFSTATSASTTANGSVRSSSSPTGYVNRRSLPPQALFARSLKRFHEEALGMDEAAARQRESSRMSVVSSSMSLEDILHQPLFGEQPGSYR